MGGLERTDVPLKRTATVGLKAVCAINQSGFTLGGRDDDQSRLSSTAIGVLAQHGGVENANPKVR